MGCFSPLLLRREMVHLWIIRKREKRLVKTEVCKWCYQVYLLKDKDNHLKCLKNKARFNYTRKRSIGYDKTNGQTNDRTVI